MSSNVLIGRAGIQSAERLPGVPSHATIERPAMSSGFRSIRRVSCAIGACCLGLIVATPASAGPIVVDTYYEFSFGPVGADATGCDPADPAGQFCFESTGTLTTFADAPAWTFVSGGSGSTFTVTDAFTSGDRFEIFDFGASIGFTSLPVDGAACGDDPVPCLADPNMSHGEFSLGAGAHSITIVLRQGDFGAGYFLLEDGAAVPEPATLTLLATGVGAALYRRRRRS